jgi:hypothetical protein
MNESKKHWEGGLIRTSLDKSRTRNQELVTEVLGGGFGKNESLINQELVTGAMSSQTRSQGSRRTLKNTTLASRSILELVVFTLICTSG